jgi:hypothetical protein
MRVERQYSVAYLLGEMALIAVALAAGRWMLVAQGSWIESQALCYCVAMTAGCGAAGGLCLRMAMGLVAGGVFAVASMPMLWVLISGARL